MKLGIWLIAAVSLAFGTETRQAHAEILNTDNILSIRPSPGTAGKPLKVVMIVKGPWQNANLFYNIFYDTAVALSATTSIPIGKVANGASKTVTAPYTIPVSPRGKPVSVDVQVVESGQQTGTNFSTWNLVPHCPPLKGDNEANAGLPCRYASQHIWDITTPAPPH
jgi:hypothetical protein